MDHDDKVELSLVLGVEREVPCLNCHHDLAEHLLPQNIEGDEGYMEYGCVHMDDDGHHCNCESFN